MQQRATKQTGDEMLNGVDVTALHDTIKAISGNKKLAKFQFRTHNKWIDGAINRSTIKGFYGCGEEDKTRGHPHIVDADKPSILLGHDSAPSPVEFLLHSLAACVTSSIVYHAAANNVEIKAIDSELEGELDIRGFLGISDDVRKGYQSIQLRVRVKTKADPEQIGDFTSFSPVYSMVSQSVPVELTIETY